MKQDNKHGDASYHQKLIRFNATDKYHAEMEFMKGVIDAKPGEAILDYGCGLGHMVCYLQEETDAKVFGFDIQEWWKENERPNWFKMSYWFLFNTIYFMHSFAHIPDIKNALIYLRDNVLIAGGRIIVFTPNKQWIEAVNNPDYIPDPTVIQHYSPEDLRDIFNGIGFEVTNMVGQGLITGDHQERICMIATINQ